MDGQGDHGGSVAIIGMACRFPGASDPAGFHRLTTADGPRFGPVTGWPGGELHAALVDDWVARPALLEDTGLGAEDIGPVRKLAAEMTALALAEAGLREAAGRSRTGLVIAGSAPGLSGLVAGELGLVGDVPHAPPASLSSLHAVVAAAQAVAAGDLDLAVAGGAELGLDPVWLALQARAGLLATSQMRVYAADPAGMLPGDGCGVVVLARLDDARAAGLPVYAEIAGWTAGSDALQAYRRADVDPADIQLIEGLGLGTADADLAELTAFTRLRRVAGTPAALGAVSASIGYTRAAAGVASLIKTALAMVTGTIPAGTRCGRPHPLIEAGDARLRLPDQPEPWPDVMPGAGRTRLAAVSSPGTAEVPAMHSLTGAREVPGVHLVLRRDHGTGGRVGSGRRTAEWADPPSPPSTAQPGEVATPPHTAVPPSARWVPSTVPPPVPSSAPGSMASKSARSLPGAAEPRGASSVSGVVERRDAASLPGTTEPPDARSVPGMVEREDGSAPLDTAEAGGVLSPGPVDPLGAPAIGEPAPRPEPAAVPRRVADVTWGSASHASVFAFCGEQSGELAGRLEAIAASVEVLPESELPEVDRHLAFGVLAGG